MSAISLCKSIHICTLLSELYWYSSTGKMLGQILVTKQSGPEGKIVSKVWTCELKLFFACMFCLHCVSLCLFYHFSVSLIHYVELLQTNSQPVGMFNNYFMILSSWHCQILCKPSFHLAFSKFDPSTVSITRGSNFVLAYGKNLFNSCETLTKLWQINKTTFIQLLFILQSSYIHVKYYQNRGTL